MATDIESTGGISDHLPYNNLNSNQQQQLSNLQQQHQQQDKSKRSHDERERKGGTISNGIRVYKKSSLNSKITVYLGRRDFVDHISHVDPIDGVVLIDRDYIQNRKVFGHVLATFRYGREDLDVLGLTFRKELYLVNEQIFPQPDAEISNLEPKLASNNTTYDMINTNSDDTTTTPTSIQAPSGCSNQDEKDQLNRHDSNPNINNNKPKINNKRPLTRLQERLLKKLGPNAFPFFFELPPLCPASVTLQPGPGDTGKPCGVDYELKAYVADSIDEKPHKRDQVRLAIRKIMYAPSRQGEQPSVEVSKDFVMSPNKLNLEASLDKELYHHGESIAVNVHIANNSNRTVKKVKVSVRQFADICLFSAAQYKCSVADLESEEGCPVGPGFTLSKVYYLRPLLANNKDKRGLALDGQLKHEDTNLASSTLITDPSQRENLGIVVQYKVRVKLSLGPLGGELTAELPFTLMHPKPIEFENDQDQLTQSSSNNRQQRNNNNNNSTFFSNVNEDTNSTFQSHNNNNCHVQGQSNSQGSNGQVEADLIQLDDDDDNDDDDIIFEDFARLRLEQAGDFQSPSMDAS